MTTIRKPIKKRRRCSPSSSSISASQFGQRLRKLRNEQRNLWDADDDDDDDDDDDEQYAQSRYKTDNKTYIVLSDSEDETMPSRKHVKYNKSKQKSLKKFDETYRVDNEPKQISKCATCLICSILTTLTSHNCCSKHLSLLVNCKNSRKQTTNNDQWPPEQVMIVPMTDEFIQRYLTSQDIYRLRTRPSPTEISRTTRSPRKLSTKCTMTSDAEKSNKNKSKVSKKSTNNESEQPSSSSIVIEPTNGNSEMNNPTDTTYTLITSTSTTTNSFESPSVLDTGQLQQSSDQPLIIDESQNENQQENSTINNAEKNKQKDPWTPINDETHAEMEVALNTIDQSSEEQIEFTPATARRTPTELMASLLPRIRLKKGRFHQGKLVGHKNSLEKPTTTTTTNQCQSSKLIQPSPVTTSASTNSINTRPLSTLATIVEDESLVIHSARSISDKSSQSSHILSERHENTTEGLSDTVMSCLFAQDESSQHDNIHIVTKTTVTNEALVPPSIVIEDCSNVNDPNQTDISQSSLLSNDTQQFIPTITNEKTITPSRISYRTNPDGTRVSISRPILSTNHQSPVISIRRTSTDVTPTTSHANR